MDTTDTTGGFNDGGDPADLFHRKEAISAVAEDPFLAEEEDDDYEDLYNDVNVGEGCLQSLHKNDDLAAKIEEEDEDKKVETLPPPLVQQTAVESNPAVPEAVSMFENDDGVEPHQNLGFRPNELPGPPVGGEFRVELAPAKRVSGLEEQSSNVGDLNHGIIQQHHTPPGSVGNTGNMNIGFGNGGGGFSSGGGGTILFVGDLHWWTTDAELETELCKYGPLKEVKFFDEKASGKSKGYCQVEFYDPASATACKEAMNGHVFNGRPCNVAYASPYSVKRMGEAQVNRSQQMAQNNSSTQPRRDNPGNIANNNPPPVRPATPNAPPSAPAGGAIDGNRNNFGRGNWGRGNFQGMGNRGTLGPMRNYRVGGIGGRGLLTPPIMHPQAMMGQGFDPGFVGPMGQMGTYGGFPGGPVPPFSGMMPSFPHMGNVGLAGVAPHVNPAFFGRGMPMSGMGMMPTGGMDGHGGMGMWADPSMGGWGSEDHGARGGEPSYAEEEASDHYDGERDWTKEKDKGSERDWSGMSDRLYRDEREIDTEHDVELPEKRQADERDVSREREREPEQEHRSRERSRDRDRDRDRERDRYSREDRDNRDNRDRERYSEQRHHHQQQHRYEEDADRGRSSRSHKSRFPHDEDGRSRSRDGDYAKRQRLSSE